MANEVNRYAAATASLIGAMVLVFFVVLLTSGGIRLAGVIVLLVLIIGLGALIGAQVGRQRKERLER